VERAERSPKGCIRVHYLRDLPPQKRLSTVRPTPVPTSELMDPRFIDDLARKLSAAVPQSLTNIRRDLEDNFKAVLQSALSRMDLVTRQEFDVQAGVLRRTREKLEAIEAKLSALEAEANKKSNPTPTSGGMS
jgi:BMFP domain-containing protein YqiC